MTLSVAETRDIATCQALRREVFTLEQGVSEADDLDGKDAEALHVLASRAGQPIGTARVLVFGTTAKIGRVCVLAAERKGGIGVALIEVAQELAARQGATRAILGAMVSAQGFYERLGYRAFGEVFDDAGLPHQMMERAL